MRYAYLWWTSALLVLLACEAGPSASKREPKLTPSRAMLLAGMEQRLEVQGVAGSDWVWTSSAGRLLADGASARFVAPSTAGDIQISVTRRSTPKAAPLLAMLRVVTASAEPLELEDATTDSVVGARGQLHFQVSPAGKTGALGRFALKSGDDTRKLEVRVVDGARAELTVDGVTIDGNGALKAAEERALRDLVTHGFFPGLALIPLDLACAQAPLEPRTLAALLFPWQLLQKYLTWERKVQTAALADASACRYYTMLDEDDSRPAAEHPLLANGQYIPFAFGYLPLDDDGELSRARRSQALVADEDVYGPGGGMCRGACGADCEENNCGKPREEWRCVKQDGRNTGEKQLWTSYTCYEHPGCIEHDACFDNCKVVFGVDSWDAAFCMRGCDMQATMGYGADQGVQWAQGYGPTPTKRPTTTRPAIRSTTRPPARSTLDWSQSRRVALPPTPRCSRGPASKATRASSAVDSTLATEVRSWRSTPVPPVANMPTFTAYLPRCVVPKAYTLRA